MDHKGAYKPVEKEFIDGEWAFFKKAWSQGRLYKGKKVMHWDAETETSLAKHELDYKTLKDDSVFLKFKKKGTKNEYFVIWTTTPWTIPFNLAIMVNPDLDYVKAKVNGEIWIVAKDLADVFISDLLGKKVEILEEFKGSKLEGEEYEHIFYDDLKDIYDELKKKQKKVHTIILSKEYVDTSSGTGLVHCAPGSGPEDQEAAAKYGIETFNTLNERGEFENLGKFTGLVARKDDSKFIEEFEKRGALITKTKVDHEYPHSWRSHKPVIFRTTDQWFLKIEDLVPKLLDMNKKVKWVPKKSGESYEKWTENLKDNSVTRQRFWGCPIPIWINTENQEDIIVIGGVKEFEKLTGKKFTDLGLHKPWIDKIIIRKGKKEYKRIADVADVWIDSGTTSWNCLYNDSGLIKKYFPADLVLEGTEHTRLWFSLLQICSSIMFGKSSFNNVFAHGMILDYQGTKMSKSLGNIISPYEVIDKYSVDIFRNYICQITAGENINFSWEDIKVKQRNLILLDNIANYILDLEKQKPKKGKAGIEERWMISKYHSTLKRVSELFEEYRLDETIGEIESLYMQLSRDYIKFVRGKAGENSVVLGTLKEVYIGILKMFCTICPFLTENIWQKMNQKEKSIHFCEWPKFNAKKIDKKLETEFDVALQVIEKGLAERDKAGIGLKWPLAKATYNAHGTISNEVENIIAGQINVKKLVRKNIKELINIKVELDTKLTPELEAEGFAREISRRIQAERKKKGLQKSDSIDLKLTVGSELNKRLKKHINFIKQRTGSKSVIFVDRKVNDFIIFKVKNEEIGINF